MNDNINMTRHVDNSIERRRSYTQNGDIMSNETLGKLSIEDPLQEIKN